MEAKPSKQHFPNLLRQDQVETIKAECDRLKSTMQQPHAQLRHVMIKQLKAQEKTLAEGTPQPFEEHELDAAVARERDLRETITAGMPSSREMRRNMPGVVGRHMRWEKRIKPMLSEWKYLRRRLYAGSDDPDVANLEQFRPVGSPSHDEDLAGAQIPGKDFHIPLAVPVPGAVMTDGESEVLKRIDPELHSMMGVLTGAQRVEVLSKVRKVLSDAAATKVNEFLAEGKKREEAANEGRGRGRPPSKIKGVAGEVIEEMAAQAAAEATA